MMPAPRVFLHRYISWVLVVVSLITVSTGYVVSRGLFADFTVFSYLHRVFEIVFLGLVVAHILYTAKHFKMDLKKTVNKIGWGQRNELYLLRIVQRVSAWMIVIATLGMVLTGLNGYPFFAQAIEDVIPFDPHRVLDVLLITTIIIHVVIGIRFLLMRRRVNTKIARRISLTLAILLLVLTLAVNVPVYEPEPVDNGPPPPDSIYAFVDGNPLTFEPEDVVTTRPDIFKPGFLSMFDVLVHLDNIGKVDLEYHFNSSMNTHVIDSLNGEPYWWYQVKYSGGWPENNVYRMDHYIWKPGTTLRFFMTGKERLDSIYQTYVEEVQRLADNGGVTILSEITIDGINTFVSFQDIVVTPHNLRNDTFQDGVLTAIDVIMTLGDLGLIDYELKWYEAVGRARVVKNYWVESINNQTTTGTCGFVYDTGSLVYRGFNGNHIHLPSDANVLNSPEYMRWFWICV
jgi:succinate dehydrogenase/fumarate reductase cytochrome b subunit